jgi:alpha-L-arabinofuranosidase
LNQPRPFVGFQYQLAALTIVLGVSACPVRAQTIFDQNFDGGYSGSFETSFWDGGSPTGTNHVLASGGNPNGCWQETVTPTTASDYYAGAMGLMTVSGITDPNPADYALSFDARGSQAAVIQFVIQTWPQNYFGGAGPVINATTNCQLTAANAWQTFGINLGNVTSASPVAATWQLAFQIDSWLWNGPGFTDTLSVDNIILTQVRGLKVAGSANASAFGGGVTFTATVQRNGNTASNATGQVVFYAPSGAFSTNTVGGGIATSSPIATLPVGADLITAIYSGGNLPAITNTISYLITAPPQDALSIFTDNLVNGFQSWSWATVDLENTNPVHSGGYSISVTDGGNSQALAFEHPDFNTTPYSSFSFWVNGGATGGQRLQVWGLLDGAAEVAYPLAPLPANSWEQITIPLSALHVANKPNCTQFWIQGNDGGAAQPAFYVDDVQLLPAPAPAVVNLGVDAGHVLQTVDARQFGVNTGTWDGSLGYPQTLPLLEQAGYRALRWPGGSTSDQYHWANDPTGNATFQNFATNLGAQVFTTVNYGTGTPGEAAAWVLSANQTNHCSFKYWEIGNECYGTWETDSNAVPHDPYTYANAAIAYIQQMKAAYPAVPIKVGVVVVPGENSYSNNATHFAVNPRTGSTNYGWTPIVLSRMAAAGVLPDFLIHHFYWQYTTYGWTPAAGSADSDALLLQVAGNPSPSNWSDWASAATDLRQQITDYIGAAGTNLELCVTENNSDAGAMGRQSTSLINGLYLADSTCQLMKTEFRSYLWWVMHDGGETAGDFDPTLYGWRQEGGYGILDNSNNPFPTYYAEKLLQYFARPGDSVLNGASDNLLLSAYAVRRTNGALAMLVINKDMTNNLNAQIALTNFAPSSTATIQSYGIPQDQAAEDNAAASLQDLATTTFASAGTNFSYALAPLSLTLFTFAPAPSALSVTGIQAGQVKLLLRGQPGTPYVIQSSPDLKAWTPVSTNNLVGSTLNVTLPIGAPRQYYRAVWEP